MVTLEAGNEAIQENFATVRLVRLVDSCVSELRGVSVQVFGAVVFIPKPERRRALVARDSGAQRQI